MPTIETLARHMQAADTLVSCFVAFNLLFIALLHVIYHVRWKK